MNFQKLSLHLILLIFTFLVVTGCSKEEETKKPVTGFKKVIKEKQEKAVQGSEDEWDFQGNEDVPISESLEEYERKNALKIADDCQKKYNLCINRCGYEACEDMCMNDLSFCERDLPDDLKTFK